MRRARVMLKGRSRPVVGDCEVRGGVLSCRVMASKRPAEFVEMEDGSVRIVQAEANRSWPMQDVESIDWLEAEQAA